MKALIGILVVVGGMVGLLFYTGMFDFNPVQQAKDARAKVAPGMTWEQVADAVGDPKEYRVFVERERNVGGQKIKMVELGPANRFSRDGLKQRLDAGTLPEGFTFPYVFTAAEAFDVVFNAEGNVIGVQDQVGIKHLLDVD